VTVYGLQTMEGRIPTFLLNIDGVPAADAAVRLAERGFGVWAHDNWYSLGLREKLPYPKDALRVGLIHYNTADEIDRFVAELARLG
jgi:selenocysteine lyase/cysteine desulfurase